MMPNHGAMLGHLPEAGVAGLVALAYLVVIAIWGLVAFFVLYQAVYRGVRRALREAGGIRPGMGSQPPLGS